MNAWTQNAKNTVWNRTYGAHNRAIADMPATATKQALNQAIGVEAVPATIDGPHGPAVPMPAYHHGAAGVAAEFVQMQKDISVKNAALVTAAEEIAALKAERDANIQTIHDLAEDNTTLRTQRQRALQRCRARGHNGIDHFDRAIYESVTKAKQYITKAGLALEMRELCKADPIHRQVENVCSLLVERSGTITLLKAERDELNQRLAQAIPTVPNKSAPAKTG